MSTSVPNNHQSSVEKILFLLFCFYPIGFLTGNLIINILVLSIAVIFIYINFKKKIINYKDKIFLILFFFFITLVINLIFSNDQILSISRVVKLIAIILFLFSFKYLVDKEVYLNNILKTWSIIFLIVIFDLIFEFIFGNNILGFKSVIPGRLISFTGNEMVIGHFFSAFSLIILSYFKYKYPDKKNTLMALSIFFILIAFFIGERSNFIRTFLMISLFILFLIDFKIKFKISFGIIFVFFAILFVSINENYKKRYFNQLSELFKKDGIKKFLAKSQYGAHYNVAYNIFEDNKIFGVGLKNFRNHSFEDKYIDKEHKFSTWGGATHPHQIHFEFLSETGLFGYISFLFFIFFSLYFSIKSYLYNGNYYQFSGICYVVATVLPLIPSGSFFTTYSSGLFWINYAFMVAFIKKVKY